jgi:hypothetical protein
MRKSQKWTELYPVLYISAKNGKLYIKIENFDFFHINSRKNSTKIKKRELKITKIFSDYLFFLIPAYRGIIIKFFLYFIKFRSFALLY